MSHYALEKSVTGKPCPFTTFYYPHGMFKHAQTTLNTLVTLEDAFIAAYLVGVRNFSNSDLRVTAARIMGIESDHRTLARVVGPGVAKRDGGPIEHITGAQGVAESVDPPNNNGYERTLKWTNIGQAVAALTAVRRQGRGREGRVRHGRRVPLPPLHAAPAQSAGRVLRLRRLIEAELGTRVRGATPSGVAHSQLSP